VGGAVLLLLVVMALRRWRRGQPGNKSSLRVQPSAPTWDEPQSHLPAAAAIVSPTEVHLDLSEEPEPGAAATIFPGEAQPVAVHLDSTAAAAAAASLELPPQPNAATALSLARQQAAEYKRMRQLAAALDLPGGVAEAEAFVAKYRYSAEDIDTILHSADPPSQ